MTTAPFGARLTEAMATRGPLCVGIDPHPSLLSAWGLDATPSGLERFAMTTVEALADRVAVLKPQSAFFEAFGSAGVAVLEKVLAAGQAAGALMLLDAKRGDIGSTMAAYAAAYLTDGSKMAADALTVSPFLGFGSLQPAIDAALASGRGLFVLCRTSNPEGRSVQLAQNPAQVPVQESVIPGMTVSAEIASAAAKLNAGADPMGSIGLVVGATVTDVSADLEAVNGPLLAPGIGAQGATAADLKRVFGGALRTVLPTASRSVLTAGPSLDGLRDAAARTLYEVRAALC
ncbi:MAG: orotidine-5'-phosphate decarboxylase [Nakamurella sp.]